MTDDRRRTTDDQSPMIDDVVGIGGFGKVPAASEQSLAAGVFLLEEGIDWAKGLRPG